jgi:uncharacterized protein
MSMVQPNASGAQREPSMEEILASIRRIIEDSDTVQRADKAELAEAKPINSERAEAKLVEVQAAKPEPEAAAADDVDAFRAELGAGQAVEAVPTDRQAVDEVTGTAAAMLPEELVAETPEASFIEQAEPLSTETDASATPQPSMSETVPHTSEEESEPMSQTPPQQPGSFFDQGDSRSAGNESRASSASSASPLVSSQTGSQVAAAFSDLSVATEARGRRTFDDIAEEMLRPMLRDWLDNNLPHLVERLVREEIERIARGGSSPR